MSLTSLPVEILERICLHIARSTDIAENRGSRLFNFGERVQTEVVTETSSADSSSENEEDDEEDDEDYDEDYDEQVYDYTDSPWRTPSVSDGSFEVSDSGSVTGEGATLRQFQPDEDADRFSDRDLAALALTCHHMYAIANKILYRRGGTAVRLADYTETVLTHPHLMEQVEHLTIAKSRRSGAVTEELAQLCNEIFVSHNVVSPGAKPVTCWAGERETFYRAWPVLSSKLVTALLLRLPNVKTIDIHFSYHLGCTPYAYNPPRLPNLKAVRVVDGRDGVKPHEYGWTRRVIPMAPVQWILDAAPNLVAIDTSNIAFVTALQHPSVSVFAMHRGFAKADEIQQLMENMPRLRSLIYHSSSLFSTQMKAKDLFRAVRASGNEFLVVDARFDIIAREKLSGTDTIAAVGGEATNLSILPVPYDPATLQVSNDISIVPVSYDSSIGLVSDDLRLVPEPVMPLVDIHKLRIKAIRINLLPVHEVSGSPWDCRLQCIIPRTAEIIAVDLYRNWNDIIALADYVIRCCRVVKAIYIRNLGHDYQILDNEEPVRRLQANGIICQAYSHIDLLQLADPFGFVQTSF